MTFGIASVDNYIEAPRSAHAREVWAQYQAQVQELAGSGARVVLLPEKIDVLAKADAEGRKQWLASLAREKQGVAGGRAGRRQRTARAAMRPGGSRRMGASPPTTSSISWRRRSASSSRAMSSRSTTSAACATAWPSARTCISPAWAADSASVMPRVMLVPAWDFDRDAEMAANMTKMRGIENGLRDGASPRARACCRSSDAYGRVLAVERSAAFAGQHPVRDGAGRRAHRHLYTRTGDLLGWMCVVAAVLLSVLAYRRRKSDLSPFQPDLRTTRRVGMTRLVAVRRRSGAAASPPAARRRGACPA